MGREPYAATSNSCCEAGGELRVRHSPQPTDIDATIARCFLRGWKRHQRCLAAATSRQGKRDEQVSRLELPGRGDRMRVERPRSERSGAVRVSRANWPRRGPERHKRLHFKPQIIVPGHKKPSLDQRTFGFWILTSKFCARNPADRAGASTCLISDHIRATGRAAASRNIVRRTRIIGQALAGNRSPVCPAAPLSRDVVPRCNVLRKQLAPSHRIGTRMMSRPDSGNTKKCPKIRLVRRTAQHLLTPVIALTAQVYHLPKHFILGAR